MNHVLLVLLAAITGAFAIDAGEPEKMNQRVRDLTQLAEKGDGLSQLKLALIHDEAGNSGMAAVWYRKASDKGYVLAAQALGFKCFKGDGVPEDRSEAVTWFRMAAEHGDPTSQFCLATCYVNGEGVSRNLDEAVIWCRAAAEQNHPEAQYMLGVLYGRGEGVPQDYEKAFEWVSMAAAQGHPQAKSSLETLQGMMTPAQLAKAKSHTPGGRSGITSDSQTK